MISESNPDLVLRVQVESGGCHGFQYLMSLTNMSKVDRAEDTVFESEKRKMLIMMEVLPEWSWTSQAWNY